MAERKEEPAPERAESRKSPPVLLMFLALLVLVGGLGVGFFVYVSRQSGQFTQGGEESASLGGESAAITEEWPKDNPINVLTNLAPPGTTPLK